MSSPLRADMATARELVTLAIHDDPALFRVIGSVAADPMLTAGVMHMLATALAATFSSPEDWQRHLAAADLEATR